MFILVFKYQLLIKVGDNSMPNMMPLLTGLRIHNQSTTLLTHFEEENRHQQIQIDELPWLWKKFQG